MRHSLQALCGAVLLLSGCASFDGSPRPLLDAGETQAVITPYRPTAVAELMKGKNAAERAEIRNRVVNSYLLAYDMTFDRFRRSLSRGTKGGNIVFDSLTLGMTGLASSWVKAADELAAAATAVGGVKSTVNRELYFEKTLPVLLSLMESRRLAVRADILKGLKMTEAEYPIEAAFADLWRYQSAASLDGAIQQTATAAAEEDVQAEIDYSKAKKFCRVEPAVADKRRSIQTRIENFTLDQSDNLVAAGAEKLRKAVVATGKSDAVAATTADQAWEQVSLVSDYLLTMCTTTGIDAFEADLIKEGVL